LSAPISSWRSRPLKRSCQSTRRKSSLTCG
jgi:hypothetical protein